MKKQQIAGVVLAAVLVLGGAAFAGYQSTRYPRTLKAANQAGQEAEAVSLYEKAVNVSPRKAEAPDGTDSAPQSYTEPLTFRRNGIYRIRCYAMNQCGEAGEPTELNFTIQLDPEKYHMNS